MKLRTLLVNMMQQRRASNEKKGEAKLFHFLISKLYLSALLYNFYLLLNSSDWKPLVCSDSGNFRLMAAER